MCIRYLLKIGRGVILAAALVVLVVVVTLNNIDPRELRYSGGGLADWLPAAPSDAAAGCENQDVNGYQQEDTFCLVSDPRVEITNLSVSQLSEETAVTGGYVLPIEPDFYKEPEETYCVPRKIHFVWVGEEIREKNRRNIKTFVDLNPNYQIYLWTEVITESVTESLPGVIIGDINVEVANYTVKDLFDAETNVGGKADIIRYEVVYRNGGVYYDTDSVCVKPLMDVLTHSFVSHNPGINSYQNIQNSVFGFPKHSRFLEYTLRILRWNILQAPTAWVPIKCGPVFFSGCFVKYADTNINLIHQKYIALPQTENSLTYQTYDATWIKEGE